MGGILRGGRCFDAQIHPPMNSPVFAAAQRLGCEKLPSFAKEDACIDIASSKDSKDSQASDATVPGDPGRPPVNAGGGAKSAGAQPPKQAAEGRASGDIFTAPLVSELQEVPDPAEGSRPKKRIRSVAPAVEGDSFVARGQAPKARKEYSAWTEGEEQRLLEGFKKYGKQWSMISKCCGLRHRNGMQIKDKWRILKKNGLVHDPDDDGEEEGSPS
ncbi:unnamed protein product [Symbiodinium pilosum]|uniref:Myb-like domain-containing protein n=1 Tax=Symbiodinium pilosum TaxID=2952 RepID=A0A812Q383_SYMPI|nr:unnamed protein product [Symbiodinium pilosum]